MSTDMVEVEHVTTASVGEVMQVLADGWLYGLWVTGASHIRAVDDGWPAPGAQIHHAVGAWPLLIKDRTECRDWDPAGHLRVPGLGPGRSPVCCLPGRGR